MPPKQKAPAKDGPIEQVDVLIIGSGPIGATFARKIVDAGRRVLMIDIGDQATPRIGDHKKNSVAVQKDISLFTNTVRGELSVLSIPIDKQQDVYAEPISWEATPWQTIHNGQNPNQLAWDNLPAAAATRVVGGMGNHWTCCTPRQFPGIERSELFTFKEWDRLYATAENLFNTNSTSFDHSIRGQLVKHVLQNTFKDREFKNMPLACRRNQPNKQYVEWTCPATILGDLAEPKYHGKLFELRANTQCLKFQLDSSTGQVAWVVVNDLMKDKIYSIKADKYVLCAGAVLTVGILFKSGLDDKALPALGHYMTEQSMAFCQILLKRSLVDSVKRDPYKLGWKTIVAKFHEHHKKDPLPFPYDDPDPQVYQPFSKERPWHTQIHRDAFGYGEVPATVDQRLVVDLRFFGYNKPVYENCVEFSHAITDEFGMPQPTFHFRIHPEDADRTHAMMKDMVEVASALGGFIPGAEPKYLVPGSALHICGTYRAGDSKKDSVVDKNSQVWGQNDLYLGGCGVIPTQNACNPTLTAACFAIHAADHLVKSMK